MDTFIVNNCIVIIPNCITLQYVDADESGSGALFSDYRRFLPCYVRAVKSSTYPNLCRQLYEAYPSMHEMYAAKCLPNATDSISTIE